MNLGWIKGSGKKSPLSNRSGKGWKGESTCELVRGSRQETGRVEGVGEGNEVDDFEELLPSSLKPSTSKPSISTKTIGLASSTDCTRDSQREQRTS